MHSDHAINRASWDELAAVHGQDPYYDSEALVAGASSLIEEEESALALAVGTDLAGLRVLHMQCHLGFDAITFARRGARVTGIDFSAVALARAAALAERCAVDVDWVCADATEPPKSLDSSFDLAWATMGVLCWIADASAWMCAVAATLRPGGRLVLIDGHPLGGLLKFDPLRVVRSYGSARRKTWDAGWDYATSIRTGPQVQFLHSIGEIVSAAADSGLTVTHLLEHTDVSDGLCVDRLVREDDGRYRSRADGHPLPVLLTLIARR